MFAVLDEPLRCHFPREAMCAAYHTLAYPECCCGEPGDAFLEVIVPGVADASCAAALISSAAVFSAPLCPPSFQESSLCRVALRLALENDGLVLVNWFSRGFLFPFLARGRYPA